MNSYEATFHRLPLLLRSKQAQILLTLSPRALRVLRESVPELAVRLPGLREWRYRKIVIARLLGIS